MEDLHWIIVQVVEIMYLHGLKPSNKWEEKEKAVKYVQCDL